MTDEKSPVGLVKRPRYDPIIEDLNEKARKVAHERSQEIHADEETRVQQADLGRSQGLQDHGQRVNPSKSDLNYLGSFCIHVYLKDSILPSAQFMTLNAGKIPQFLAVKALDHLNLAIKEAYGVKHKSTLDKRKSAIQSVKKDP